MAIVSDIIEFVEDLGAREQSWLDEYSAPSYRGVAFDVETANGTGGRHTVAHEFSGRETGFAEDIGRKTKTFSLSGHIVGDDYFSRRNALLAAFDKEGPGELVHPYRGTLQVNLVDYTDSEVTDKGRIYNFTANFVEAGEIRFPVQADDAKNGVLGAGGDVIDDQGGIFGTILNVLKQPQHVLDGARNVVGVAQRALTNGLSIVGETSGAITDAAFSIRQLESELDTLLATPSKLFDQLKGSIQLFKDVFLDPDDARRALKTLETFGSEFIRVPNQQLEHRVQEQQNQDAIVDAVRQIALAERASVAIDVDYASVDEALAEREELSAIIEEEKAGLNTNDELFQSLSDLDAGLVEALPLDNLARIIEFQTKTTQPALILAYDIFKDATQEQDIIDRNRIRHPGFVEGDQVIEVLSE